MSGVLTEEQIKALLHKELAPRYKSGYPPPTQNGPLRFIDRETRCASKGCGSPTHMKVEGVPYCSMHSLRKLNDLVIEMTAIIERLRDGCLTRSSPYSSSS